MATTQLIHGFLGAGKTTFARRIVDGNLDRVPQRAEAELRTALATVWHRSKAITPSDIANVCAAMASHAGTLG
jgi:hypothetical protein